MPSTPELQGWLAAVVDAADDAIISRDLAGIIVSWNRGAERIFGYSAAEMVGRSISSLLPTDRLREEAEILERIKAGERIEQYETVRRRKDGTTVEVSLSLSPVRNSAGTIVGASKIAREITQKRIAEDLSRRLSSIVESSDDAILSKDLNGTIQSWNAGAERLFGYTAEEIVGSSVTKLIPLGLQEEEPAILARLRRGERVEHFETVRRCKDGSLVDVSLTVSPIRNAAGHVVGASKIVRNISDRRKNHDAARRLAAIVESADDAIASKDLQGVIQSWNRGAERLFGYSAAEIIGQSVLKLIPVGRHNEEPAILERLRRGERVENYETIRCRKDGTLIDVSLTVSPIFDESGRVVGASKIARDISEQKRMLRELQEAHDKVVAANRAKDDFLAALSHELRTPLNPVLLIASEAAQNTTLPASVRSDFEVIRKHVELEARLIDDLLDLAKIAKGKLPLKTGRHDLHAIIREAYASVQNDLAAKHITVTCDIAPVPLTVAGDEVRLQQVIWNVLKNAAKFTPAGGRVRVTTRINTTRSCAVVEIADTGIGLDPNELEAIFDAFTQAGGSLHAHQFGGLGLGLTISRKIAELHHGSVRAVSEGRGRGATFILELPLADDRENPELPSNRLSTSQDVKPLHSLPRILLVEDHEASRMTLITLLKRRQFEVVGVANCQDARTAFNQSKFDLLICDLGLPDGDGADVIAEFQSQQGAKAIALTGYGMDADVTRIKTLGASAHLTKPVKIQELETAVRVVLGR